MHADLLRTIDVFLEGASRPLIVLLGPTASGKTGLSIDIAKYIGGEVVNADSRQLYNLLDIGTAKITREEMQGVPHHLFSILDPKEESTVGVYQPKALAAIDAILRRKRLPLLVGGSMLYIASVTDNLSFGPVADSAVHERLLREYDCDHGTTLYKKLQDVDPDTAAGLHQNNKPRVVRALELYEILKKPKSKAIDAKGELRPRKVEHKSCSYDLLLLGVERSGPELTARIHERTEQMFAFGWVQEVRDLLARGYTSSDPGMKSTGYREIIAALQEFESSGGQEWDDVESSLKNIIATKTRQYAKRQMSWWRRDERIHWIQP